MGLRYLDRPHRGRKVRPRAHPVPDLVQIVLQIGLELAQGLLVHSRGTLVGRHLPVRLPNICLGMSYGLTTPSFGMFPLFLPRPKPWLIDSTVLMSRLLGSTPTPASRSFTATTSRSASERRIGTQCLRFLPRHAPSRDQGASATTAVGIDARLPMFRTRAADQAHAASAPDATWPVLG